MSESLKTIQPGDDETALVVAADGGARSAASPRSPQARRPTCSPDTHHGGRAQERDASAPPSGCGSRRDDSPNARGPYITGLSFDLARWRRTIT